MLNGKNVIITGGVRGIGKSIAIEMAKEGAGLALCFRSNDEEAQKTKAELEALGAKVLLFKGEVADSNHAMEVVKSVKEEMGSVDVLVNNAGITGDKLLIKMKDEDFENVIDANLKGAFYFTREAAKVMVKQRSGRIINMTSIAGVKGNPGQANYSASKAGLIGLTLSNAKELGKRGITVNAVAPGMIDTDMTAVLTDEQKEKALENVVLGRFGKPEEVGKLTCFLASDNASYITGQVISIDGGIIL